jgi:3-oxoacyl-[acyl-carrier-protein] synthase II
MIMSERDVLVTGLGVISPLGNSVTEYYDNLASGMTAVAPAPWPMPEGMRGWFAAVPDFDPGHWMSAQVAAGSDRFTQFILAATTQALADADLEELDELRTAVVMGTGMGGTRSLQFAQRELERNGPEAVPKKTMIQIWPNMAAAQVAMRYGLHGPSLTLCTACAASIDAIGTAAQLISSGLADVAIAGGAEGTADVDFLQATTVAQGSYGMATASLDARQAIMPFDVRRGGIVAGEGSGVVVLESRAHAEGRGAAVYGRVRGYATLADAYHPSTPQPDGRYEALVMQQALDRADLPEGVVVDAVYAHGTGTPVGDTAELRAVNTVFADRVADVKVTSLKGAIGHSGGAAAAMNLVAALVGIERGEVLPTANTATVDPEINFELVLGKPWQGEVRAVQLNGFGFGGQNASIVVSAI